MTDRLVPLKTLRDWLRNSLGDSLARMTTGQRWTALLGLVLVGLMVAFGMPAKRVFVPAAAQPIAGGTTRPSTTTTLPLTDATTGLALPTVAAGDVPSAFDTPSLAFDEFDTNVVVPAAPPRVAALVRKGTVSGRDDASVAAVFLARSGFASTTIVDDPADSTVCARTLAAGRLVLAADGLELALRDCLLAGNATVLSFDDLGAVLDGASGSQSFSTRRGIGAALVDLARGAPTGALSGRVGIVAGARAKPVVDSVIDDMGEVGVNVVDVLALADDATNSDVADGVRRFAAETVDVVVFALPVVRQRQWLGPASVLLPSARYVVADAYDAIVADETYAPTFDGALALTSLRGPWFARAHGETPAQLACRTQWEAAATPPKMLSGTETVDVFEWCEHVAVAAQVLQRVLVSGADVRAALANARYDNASLTSALGSVDGGTGFGPVADATLVWHNACACWEERTPFAPR
jgi:hypothetical protein